MHIEVLDSKGIDGGKNGFSVKVIYLTIVSFPIKI